MDRLSSRAAPTRAPLGPIGFTTWSGNTSPAIVIYWQGRLSEFGLRAFEPAVPIGGPYIIALDIKRSEGLRGDLYSQLCVSAWNGNIQGTGGGPNCRTWSILRWFPKPGFPKPVRGRREPDCWGFSVLETSEAQDTDKDSLLLLRQLLLSHISNMRYKGPGLPWCFLEHPEDPKLCSTSPSADRCSTIWQTQSCSGMVYGDGPYLDTLWWVWTGTSRR